MFNSDGTILKLIDLGLSNYLVDFDEKRVNDV